MELMNLIQFKKNDMCTYDLSCTEEVELYKLS